MTTEDAAILIGALATVALLILAARSWDVARELRGLRADVRGNGADLKEVAAALRSVAERLPGVEERAASAEVAAKSMWAVLRQAREEARGSKPSLEGGRRRS